MAKKHNENAREDLVSRAFCLAEEMAAEETPAEAKPAPTAPRSRATRTPREKAIRSALNMLDYAACSSARLREKLTRKGYSREDVDAAIAYVVAHGQLNEARDAAHAVEYLANARLYGRRKIIESLLAKGYRREDLAAADWEELDFVAICTRYLERHTFTDREKTIAAARRRGFAMREILAALAQSDA